MIPAWPSAEHAVLFPIADYVCEELRDNLLAPSECLLPREQWPATTPRSRVHASDQEWYSIVKHAVAIGFAGASTWTRYSRVRTVSPF